MTFLAALGSLLLLSASKPDYPATARRPVAQTYGSTTFHDHYQWLEQPDDPAVQAWVAEQNRLTRSMLDVVPERPEISKRLTRLLTSQRLSYFSVMHRGGKVFAMKFEPPKQQMFLVVFDSVSDPKSERIVYDPNAVDAKGSISIDFFVPSIDGRRVAVCLSKGGSEDGSLHLFDVATAKEIGDVVPRVNYPTAGGSAAWNSDASGLWYTRYPAENERPHEDLHFYQQVWFHKVGTPVSSDTYVIGREFPRIAEIELHTSDDGKNVLAAVKNGDGGEVAHWLRGTSGKWTQIATFADKIPQAEFGGDGAVYLLSRAGAPNGKILRIGVGNPKLAAAKVLVDTTKTSSPPLPDGLRPAANGNRGKQKMSVDGFTAGRNVLYVAMMSGGPSDLLSYDRSGKPLGRIPLPPVSSVYELVRLRGDDVLVRNASYTAPARWFRYDAATKRVWPTALRTSVPADLSDAAVVREFATSRDGTRVPLNIIYRKGTKLDGTNPTILRGYGGYGISQRPGMSLLNRLWLDAGGVVAYANIRGGAEFGEDWHQDGMLLKKQNVFDDFAACAKHLIARKYTSAGKLAIEGGSNGGLLMGAVMTQHPGLFRAVVSHVGIYDMPRTSRTPNGVFNTTEFGSPDKPAELRAMMAYSPYHHVVDGTAYPAALFLTGDNDGRVDPMNSRKFVARLQSATASARPILLRTTSTAGHGIGSSLSDVTQSQTDVFSFLWRELDMGPLR